MQKQPKNWPGVQYPLNVCIEKSLKWKRKTQIPEKKKNSYKMIFQPEHAENISYIYVVNQLFESVSDSFAKQYQEG